MRGDLINSFKFFKKYGVIVGKVIGLWEEIIPNILYFINYNNNSCNSSIFPSVFKALQYFFKFFINKSFLVNYKTVDNKTVDTKTIILQHGF